MEHTAAETVLDLIERILLRRGSDSYLGESVTMLEHMLQAASLAESDGADDELICAALLHDIGHYSGEFPEHALEQGENNFHESTGACILQGWFAQRVVDCVKYHVEAKRYLCATDKAYYDQLSQASKQSLRLQGGPMSGEEVQAFGRLKYRDDILRVRIWDDQGKVPGYSTPPFEHYKALLERMIKHPT